MCDDDLRTRVRAHLNQPSSLTYLCKEVAARGRALVEAELKRAPDDPRLRSLRAWLANISGVDGADDGDHEPAAAAG